MTIHAEDADEWLGYAIRDIRTPDGFLRVRPGACREWEWALEREFGNEWHQIPESLALALLRHERECGGDIPPDEVLLAHTGGEERALAATTPAADPAPAAAGGERPVPAPDVVRELYETLRAWADAERLPRAHDRSVSVEAARYRRDAALSAFEAQAGAGAPSAIRATALEEAAVWCEEATNSDIGKSYAEGIRSLIPKGAPAPSEEEIAALIVREGDCGATNRDGDVVRCDHPSLSYPATSCACQQAARAIAARYHLVPKE